MTILLTISIMFILMYLMPIALFLAWTSSAYFQRKHRLDSVIKDADNAIKTLAGARTMRDLRARYERVEEILEHARTLN